MNSRFSLADANKARSAGGRGRLPGAGVGPAARSAYLPHAMNALSRRPIRSPSTDGEPALFAGASGLPEGFRYQADLLTAEEEQSLERELGVLPFKPFDFHGYLANRQVVAFGFRYDYGRRQVLEAEPLPSFLEPLREKIAEAFRRPPDAFRQVLINEYRAGAGIGWHRDKLEFDDVVGVSLGAPCIFRLRRKSGEGWDRVSLIVEPRSAYLLSGPSRTVWEHSVPPLDRHRYSISFRTLRGGQA
jgi:alkylated DNA repair dioxygenase AlkB